MYQLTNVKNAVFGVLFEIFCRIDDFAVIHPADLARVSRFKRIDGGGVGLSNLSSGVNLVV